jgi:drug/metabolite transporter (DMT)-like permease
MQSSVNTAASGAVPGTAALRARDAIEAYAMLAFTMIAWGANSVAARLAVGQASPMVIVCLRWALIAAVLGVALRRELAVAWPELRRRWLQVVPMAVAGYAAFNALYYAAAHYTSGVNISILQGSIPMLVAIGGFLVYRERLGLVQVAAIAITLLGVAVVATQGHVGMLGSVRFNIGDGFTLTACVFYASYTLGLRNRPKMPGLVFFTAMAIVAFASSVPMLGYEAWSGGVQWPTTKGWLVLAFIVIFPSFLAQLSFMRGVQLIGTARAGLFINLVPLTGALLVVAVLGEPLAAYHMVALALIVGGILVAEAAGRRRAKRAALASA